MPPRPIQLRSRNATRRFQTGMLACTGLAAGSLMGLESASAQSTFYPVDFRLSVVELVDVNADGILDFILGTSDTAFAVSLGDGSGALLSPVQYETQCTFINEIVAADLDGDLDIDLALGGYPLEIFLNRGDGTFEPGFVSEGDDRNWAMATVDMDRDGDIDIVMSVKDSWSLNVILVWLRNNGDAEFTEAYRRNLTPDNYARSIGVGDLDDDGDIDIALTTENYKEYAGEDYFTYLNVFLNVDGRGEEFTLDTYLFPEGDESSIETAGELRLADIDGDHDLDVVTDVWSRHTDEASVDILKNIGGGQFEWGLPPLPGNSLNYCDADVGDADGDGDLDIVIATGWGQPPRILLLTNRGDGQSFDEIPIPHGQPVDWGLISQFADVNGDGSLDIVTQVEEPHGLIVTLNPITPDRPTLAQTELVRGETTTFTVTDALPNEQVFFAYSIEGAGYSRGLGVLGGLTLDLNHPIMLLGMATTDSFGEAVLSRRVPNSVPLIVIATQAVIRRGVGGSESVKTNFITAPILP